MRPTSKTLITIRILREQIHQNATTFKVELNYQTGENERKRFGWLSTAKSSAVDFSMQICVAAKVQM